MAPKEVEKIDPVKKEARTTSNNKMSKLVALRMTNWCTKTPVGSIVSKKTIFIQAHGKMVNVYNQPLHKIICPASPLYSDQITMNLNNSISRIVTSRMLLM